MRFDWRDLALWCFCAFFLGMVFGPVFFLDADILKWGSICGAGLAASLAIGGFWMNSSSHRLQIKTADQAEFMRVWKMFGIGQLVRMDLQLAADQAQQLVTQFEQGERLQRGHFVLLNHIGANIDVSDEPFVHRLVATVWEGFEAYERQGRDPNTVGMPLTERDIQTLRERIQKVREIREDVREKYLDILLPFFTSRGWQVTTDEYGQYRIAKEGQLRPPNRFS